MSSATEADSSGVVGQLQKAKNPTSTVAEPSAGTAEVERVQEMDMQSRTAENRAAALLPSEGENGMVHMDMEKVAESN